MSGSSRSQTTIEVDDHCEMARLVRIGRGLDW